MNKTELLDILQDIHPEVDYEKEKSLIDSGIFDSFDIVTLISEIAEVFDIKVPADEITPDNFNSLEAIITLLEELE